jgi:multiple sugar transport system permease protein
MKPKIKGQNVGYIFISPLIIYLFSLSIYPMIRVLYMSFFSVQPTLHAGEIFIGFENYIKVFNDPLFYISLQNTIIFVAGSVFFHLLLGLFLALLINKLTHNLFKNVCRTIILIPIAITAVAVAWMWKMIYHPAFSFVPLIFNALNLDITWALLAYPETALTAVTITNIWHATPYYMLYWLAALQSISPEIYEASEVDGANMQQRFRYITLPQLKIFFIFFACWDIINTFMYWDLVWVMTRGGPGYSTEILATYIYKQAFQALNFGYASALGSVGFLVMATVSSVLIYMMRERG